MTLAVYGEKARAAAGLRQLHTVPGKHFPQEDQAPAIATQIAELALDVEAGPARLCRLLETVPRPARHRHASGRPRPDRRIGQHLADRPLHVLAQGAAEVGICGQARVGGGLDEAPDEPMPEVIFGALASVDGKHRGVPAAFGGVGRRAAKDLGPVVSQPLHVIGVTRVGERVVELRVGQAPLVMGGGEREERGRAARELKDRWP
jgi:hypothetical protein